MKKLRKLSLKEVESHFIPLSLYETEHCILGGSGIVYDETISLDALNNNTTDFNYSASMAVANDMNTAIEEANALISDETDDLNNFAATFGLDPDLKLVIEVVVSEESGFTHVYFDVTDEYGNFITSTK